MAEEQNTVDEPEQTVPLASDRQLNPAAHPGPSGDEDAAADERTSPFPYAENFAEWVADETATPEGQQRGREPDDADS